MDSEGEYGTKVGLEISGLTTAEERFAAYELREYGEPMKAALDALRHMIEHDGTLLVPTTDQFLLRFLRPTKFYAMSAFKMLKGALEFKEANASVLANLTLDDERDSFMNGGSVNILAQRDDHGRRILFLTFGNNLGNAESTFRMMYLMHQAILLESKTQIFGAVVIMKFEETKRCLPVRMKFVWRLLRFFKGASTVRLKEIHIIGEPRIYDCLWNCSYFFINRKIRKRTFFHGANLTSFHARISKNILPVDLGGNLPRIDYSSADWYPVLQTVNNLLMEWNNCSIKP